MLREEDALPLALLGGLPDEVRDRLRLHNAPSNALALRERNALPAPPARYNLAAHPAEDSLLFQNALQRFLPAAEASNGGYSSRYSRSGSCSS